MLWDQFSTNLFLPSQLWSALWCTMVTTGVYHANCLVWFGIVAMGQRCSISGASTAYGNVEGALLRDGAVLWKAYIRLNWLRLAGYGQLFSRNMEKLDFELWRCPSYGREVLRHFFHISSHSCDKLRALIFYFTPPSDQDSFFFLSTLPNSSEKSFVMVTSTWKEILDQIITKIKTINNFLPHRTW